MANRQRYAIGHPECELSVVTEKMSDGRWGVVATIMQHLGDAEQVTPLPVPPATFETEDAARRFAVEQGRDWIERQAA
jgi:hypothetical protein